ncbi:hypothetical protein EVAR_24202_1 [Eumeta japonica]|uniref:Uncharacterized protein n=1 Tax=Eumeta variegata TaxID=151549 RepID=A0A4C1W653_EUMVA|nr:hypothetical protein EVAR_24202_1 [Eumeta japonica]
MEDISEREEVFSVICGSGRARRVNAPRTLSQRLRLINVARALSWRWMRTPVWSDTLTSFADTSSSCRRSGDISDAVSRRNDALAGGAGGAGARGHLAAGSPDGWLHYCGPHVGRCPVRRRSGRMPRPPAPAPPRSSSARPRRVVCMKNIPISSSRPPAAAPAPRRAPAPPEVILYEMSDI